MKQMTNVIDVFKYYDLDFDSLTGKTVISKEDLVNLCGRYARIMCTEQKRICANLATARNGLDGNPIINKNSIFSSPYPEEIR